MKNLSLFFIALILLQPITLAQEGWFWQNPLPQGNFLYSVDFVSELTGWAVGSNAILRTTNGGATWTSQTSGTTHSLRGVSFTDSDNGTAVGYNGTILRTTDGGTTWSSQTSGTTNNLLGVCFTDSYNGTAVGDGGTILRTTNGGVSFVEEDEILSEIPSNYELSQNYPNPFNPTTTISYSIPKTSFIKLSIFDILGQEIETLVDEQKYVGTYEITWYAEKLSGGIYFYRLQAGDFVETKKMVLLR